LRLTWSLLTRAVISSGQANRSSDEPVQAITALRAAVPGLDLMSAKNMVDETLDG
jgi:hypothetical protein